MGTKDQYGTISAQDSTKGTSASLTSSYPESQAPSTTGSSSAHQRFKLQSQLSYVVGGKAYLFPSIFGIYRDGMRRLALSEQHVTTPFMSVAVHSGLSGEPSIVLTSPTAIMGTADNHSFSSKTDIVVGNTSTTLRCSGFLSPVWDFTYTFDDGHQEVFEWKKSSGEAVAGLGGRSKGHKLVRISTGEVVAAWTLPNGFGVDKLAKIGLLDGARGYGWGDRWEVTVVIAAIALVERERSTRNNAAAAA